MKSTRDHVHFESFLITKETCHGGVTSSGASAGRPGRGRVPGQRRGTGDQPVLQVLVQVEARGHRRAQGNDQAVRGGGGRRRGGDRRQDRDVQAGGAERQEGRGG